MIIETLIGFGIGALVSGAGVGSLYSSAKSKLNKVIKENRELINLKGELNEVNEYLEPGVKAINWSWDNKNEMLRCPKCKWGIPIKSDKPTVKSMFNFKSMIKRYDHPPICNCQQYNKVHFHFSCPTCHFQAIMKSADDN